MPNVDDVVVFAADCIVFRFITLFPVTIISRTAFHFAPIVMMNLILGIPQAELPGATAQPN